MEVKAINSNHSLVKSTEKDAAELLYQNSIGGILVSIFAASMLVFAFDNTNLVEFKHAWWWVMLAIVSVRLIDSLWWRTNQKGTDYNGRRATLRFISGTFITAFMWCIYCLKVYASANTVELASTIIIVAAMAGGA
ncbi:MAG: putative bifunctional diguanylate cyclase/phosphodiesterase, partial [Paraglaciecola chathamensis]